MHATTSQLCHFFCASSNTGCSTGAQVFRNNDSLNSQVAADNIGHFLVRTQQNQIPIPGTISIIGLGFACLFWQRRINTRQF